jgi:hypothetical protein
MTPFVLAKYCYGDLGPAAQIVLIALECGHGFGDLKLALTGRVLGPEAAR